jgi:hypothetical protein
VPLRGNFESALAAEVLRPQRLKAKEQEIPRSRLRHGSSHALTYYEANL